MRPSVGCGCRRTQVDREVFIGRHESGNGKNEFGIVLTGPPFGDIPQSTQYSVLSGSGRVEAQEQGVIEKLPYKEILNAGHSELSNIRVSRHVHILTLFWSMISSRHRIHQLSSNLCAYLWVRCRPNDVEQCVLLIWGKIGGVTGAILTCQRCVHGIPDSTNR